MKVVLTRPDPDNDALSDALSTHGIACLVAPMLTIEATDAPGLGEAVSAAQAILATSGSGSASKGSPSTRRRFAGGSAT